MIPRFFSLLVVTTLVSGCAATATFTTVPEGATLSVKTSSNVATPRTESFATTSFGNYEFKVEKPGLDPLFGILPLKFNGGYLALDILFFAPAAFFNLREVYPYYQFDLDRRRVKYKALETDSWIEYPPVTAEAERGKRHFESK